jgi:hypothetical protein
MMILLGSLISIPYILLFFSVWIFASLIRPVITVSLGCVLLNPSAALRKGQLFVSTVTYLLLCNDKSWKKPKDDPSSFFEGLDDDRTTAIDKKTIIFVRHGESNWNETFNKGDRPASQFLLYFLPNLAKAIAVEWYFWAAGHANESWFFDSPLSEKGQQQAKSIRTYLQTNLSYVTPKEAEMFRILLGEVDEKTKKGPSSQMVSSNLRRAIGTVGIGFQDRFQKKRDNKEKDLIMILPALQEISRNPDALSITPAKGEVVPAWTDPKILQEIYKNNVDTSFHTGNKPVDSNGLKRMEEFSRIVFDDISKDSVIAGGHSLWFRSFFRTYLPWKVDHVSKNNKLVNGGIVGFTLQRIKVGTGSSKEKADENSQGSCSESYRYMIDPTSIIVLHGGF